MTTKIFSKEAEEAYLCGLFLNPKEIERNPLHVEDFYIERHRFIYQAMMNLYHEHGTFDNLLVTEELKNQKRLGAVGGISELGRIMTVEASALHTGAYAKEIRNHAQNRELSFIFQEGFKQAHKGEVNVSDIINKITNAVRVEGHMSDLEELGTRYIDYIDDRRENPSEVWGIPTPWKKFNQITGGLHASESVMLYGPSNLGKTTLVLQMGLHAAETRKYKVAFYELEMKDMKLMERLAAMNAGIPTRKVHKGTLSDSEYSKLLDSIALISTLPIRLSDSIHWTSTDIHADQVRRGSERDDLVIVDYLALLQDKADSEHMRVEFGSKNLRRMAKDRDQVVLTVASNVKDGSIKGTEEVKYSQDEIWLISKKSDNVKDKEITLTPTKRRNDGVMGYVNLIMVKNLPKFETLYKGEEEEQSLPYYHK